MKLNDDSHKNHVLGSAAPLPKRIDWHLRHKENCGCRDIPKSVSLAIEGKTVKTCTRGHKYIGSSPCPVCWPGSANKSGKFSRRQLLKKLHVQKEEKRTIIREIEHFNLDLILPVSYRVDSKT